MLDPKFLEAWTHRSGGHTVLGRKLHPLCALDLLALEAVNSPFLHDGAQCEVGDLILAVWILSNAHDPDLQVGNLELTAEGQAWVDGLIDRLELARDCAAVQAHMRDYFSAPEMMRDITSGSLNALGAPWMLGIVVTVCGKMHIPLAQAWTMPIGNLLWYRCTIEEQETASRIISPFMREEMKKAENNGKVMTMEPGESLSEFCTRTGIPEEAAAVLLHNQARGN